MYKIEKYNILFDFPIVLELLGLSRPYQGAVWTLTNNPFHDFFFLEFPWKFKSIY